MSSRQPIFDQFTNSSVKITDHTDEFRIYHFSDFASTIESFNTRGIIRDNNGEIVCKSFNYTPEFTSDNSDIIRDVLGSERLSDHYKFYKAEEVTLIRAWFYNNRWRLSTHKKIDAYTSRWGSNKSYGELFCNAIHHVVQNGELRDKILYEEPDHIMDCFFASLRTDRVYAFILRNNNETRVVCDAPETPVVYFAGEFIKTSGGSPLGVGSADFTTDSFEYVEENTSGINRPEELFFSDINCLLDYIQKMDISKHQGIMVYKFNNDNKLLQTIKLTNKDYAELYKTRGNVSSVMFRYLQIRNNPDAVDKLLYLYPEYKETCLAYEEIIMSIITNVYSSYIRRYIKHKYTQLPRERFFIMDHLHKLYLQDKVNNKITMELVTNYVNHIPPVRLNELICNSFVY